MARVIASRDPRPYLSRRANKYQGHGMYVADDELYGHREPVNYYQCRTEPDTPDGIRSS